MQKQFRRFELLLPTKLNSGLPVPDDAFADTLTELEERFGAVSSESQTIAGQWRHEGQLYRDESVRIFVDVPDTETRYLDDDLSLGSDLTNSQTCTA
jgi:hypothetical protein